MTPKLFKETENEKAQEFKKFLPVNVNCNFRSLAPALAQAENKYIVPILGTQLFSRLVTYYTDATITRNDCLSLLLEMCQYAVVRLAYWQDYDVLSVSMSDKGAADNAGEARLYRYQADALKERLKNDGFDQLDTILEFCENNANNLTEFASSDYVTTLHNSVIANTRQFNSIYDIHHSRLVFLKMKYYIKLTEDIELTHRLGDDFVNEIHNADLSNPRYIRIMEDIQKFVVFWAVAEAIKELHQIPTDKGLIFQVSEAVGNSSIKTQIVAAEELNATAQNYKNRAERYLSKAIHTMNNFRSDYINYFNFAGENAPTNNIYFRDNKNKKIFKC